jgi:hypothetical protein
VIIDHVSSATLVTIAKGGYVINLSAEDFQPYGIKCEIKHCTFAYAKV